MLARSRQLQLGRVTITSPILVPSVSSKGFPVGDDGLLESGSALKQVGSEIGSALLVSAYDLHHGGLPDGDELLGGERQSTLYNSIPLIVIDSGGYELNPYDFESGEHRRGTYSPKSFSLDDFTAVVDRLPTEREFLVVAYDSPERPRGTYQEQHEATRLFFEPRSHLRSNFLLKPELDRPHLDVASIATEIESLSSFDVIGVTEKELGATLHERLQNLARLRMLLDDSDCKDKPIHLFGCLDPLVSILYFMAGAEIFDGLSWLRYAYMEGLSIHPQQLEVIRGNLSSDPGRSTLYRYMSNLDQLRRLQERMIAWTSEPEQFEKFGAHHLILREIFESTLSPVSRER